MTVDYRYQNAFALWQGESPLNEEEIAQLRERAWKEQGILVLSPTDERLLSSERKLLCELGTRLYGECPSD